MVTGERVNIRGLGSFMTKDYDSYTGRNPKTGEPITVPCKRLPCFRVGKEVRENVLS
jgi:integration host factor subunit beta